MTKEFIIKMSDDLSIDYVIYGNFNFEKITEDEDVDVLIKKEHFANIKKYLDLQKVKYHSLKQYPNQFFVTGTNIKIHIADDLYIGGRSVQYLMKLGLTSEIFANYKKWNSINIIDFETYKKYRLIKSLLNKKKKKKLEEYPLGFPDRLIDKSKINGFLLKLILTNIFFIPFRFIKKRIWVRL